MDIAREALRNKKLKRKQQTSTARQMKSTKAKIKIQQEHENKIINTQKSSIAKLTKIVTKLESDNKYYKASQTKLQQQIVRMEHELAILRQKNTLTLETIKNDISSILKIFETKLKSIPYEQYVCVYLPTLQIKSNMNACHKLHLLGMLNTLKQNGTN